MPTKDGLIKTHGARSLFTDFTLMNLIHEISQHFKKGFDIREIIKLKLFKRGRHGLPMVLFLVQHRHAWQGPPLNPELTRETNLPRYLKKVNYFSKAYMLTCQSSHEVLHLMISDPMYISNVFFL